ncbi:MAG: hypothetical protein J5860_03240 [Clostridia bacterium]|nr:hypothetical protein [Clostridia bacterium]
MEEKKNTCSFCEFVGKVVLRAAAVIALFVGFNVLLAKVFNKRLSVQVAIEDAKEEPDDEAEENEAEETEETEEAAE